MEGNRRRLAGLETKKGKTTPTLWLSETLHIAGFDDLGGAHARKRNEPERGDDPSSAHQRRRAS